MPNRCRRAASASSAERTIHAVVMHSFCESLGKAICRAVDDVRTRACHLVDAARIFESAPPSLHVVAAAIVGAAPAALPELPGLARVIAGPSAHLVSRAIVTWLAADASARIFEREGRDAESFRARMPTIDRKSVV